MTDDEHERRRKTRLKWQRENRDRLNAMQNAANANRREDRRARTAAWREENRSVAREYDRRRLEMYPELHRAKQSARRARLKGAEVSWDRELTNLVCKEASSLAARRERLLGFSWHVDHVLPLNGRAVSGLHVWNNLAVVPGAFNVKKGNKVDDSVAGRPWR